ncbi:hypothetical protein GCM10027064_24800 [Microbacterium petrolearium]
MRHETPRFVVNHPPLPAFGVQKCRFHPRRRARHQYRDEGGVLRHPGQIQRNHRQGRVEHDRRGTVEQPLQISGDQAPQCVTDEPSVFGEPLVDVTSTVRGQDAVDDHREDRDVVAGDDRGEGDIDRRVLKR